MNSRPTRPPTCSRVPELSYVEIVMQSPDGNLRRLRVQRRRVDVPSVQDIDDARSSARRGLHEADELPEDDQPGRRQCACGRLHRQGMRALIVDVRGNPGGLLNASVEVADKFLTAGTIVSTRGRSAREDFDYQAHERRDVASSA